MHYRNLLLAFIVLTLNFSGRAAFAQAQSPCSSHAGIIQDISQVPSGVMVVVSNSAQASFTVTGPATYYGSGYSWVQQGIPAGTYTISWNSISGCTTPSSETKTTPRLAQDK